MTEGHIVEHGRGSPRIFTAPNADSRKLLADTPSIEVALGHTPIPADR
jgi:hypothetical protein